MDKKSIQVGQILWVEFGREFMKVIVIARNGDDFLLKETDSWFGALKFPLGNRQWFPFGALGIIDQS